MIIHDLFINASILISFISLANHFFKDIELEIKSPLYLRLLLGVTSGFLGVILMTFSVHINSNTILDFRNIPLALTAIYAGFLPTLISSLIIGSFRLLFFGINPASLTGLITILLIGLGSSFISRFRLSTKKKWLYVTTFSLIVVSIGFNHLIKNPSILRNLLTYFWLGTITVTILAYSYVEYLRKANKLFKKFKEESTKDFLTGLNNLRQFQALFNSTLEQAKKEQRKVSLLLIDIDFFKNINDTYGHPDGDTILRQLGVLLSKTCRSLDLISRNGGEEFSVVLPDCSQQQALTIAERIRSTVELHPFRLSSGQKINITVSIGVSTYPDTSKEFDKIIKHADLALYKSKYNGRNKVVST